MADNDRVVEVEDDSVVSVDLTDHPELAGDKALPERRPAGADPAPAPRAPAVDPEVLQQSLKSAEEARRAAEALAATERQQRDAALRRAHEAEDLVRSVSEESEEREIEVLTTSIDATNREIVGLEKELQTAYESGEFATAASTQTKLSKATAALDRLESAKSQAESDKARPKPKPTTEGSVRPTGQANAAEQYITQGGFTLEAQSWLRSHPECLPVQYGGQSSSNAKMMQGHYAALASNIQPNTPDYFKVIEEHTGHRQVEGAARTQSPQDPAPRPVAPKPRMPSAPPSREVPGGSQSPRNVREVRLTKDQQEMARLSFPNVPKEQAYASYARNLVELEAEGKIGRLTH